MLALGKVGKHNGGNKENTHGQYGNTICLCIKMYGNIRVGNDNFGKYWDDSTSCGNLISFRFLKNQGTNAFRLSPVTIENIAKLDLPSSPQYTEGWLSRRSLVHVERLLQCWFVRNKFELLNHQKFTSKYLWNVWYYPWSSYLSHLILLDLFDGLFHVVSKILHMILQLLPLRMLRKTSNINATAIVRNDLDLALNCQGHVGYDFLSRHRFFLRAKIARQKKSKNICWILKLDLQIVKNMVITCDNISSYTGFWMHEIRQRIWSNGTAWRLGGCYNSACSPPSSHDLVLLPNHKPSCVPPHQKQNKYGFYMSCLWKKVVTRRSDLSLLICVIKVLKKSNHLRGNTAKMMLAWSKAWPYGDQFPGWAQEIAGIQPVVKLEGDWLKEKHLFFWWWIYL